MAPPDPPGPHPDIAVPDMVSDYRAQLDALRNQARDLERLRADVLAAADRESHGIVTSARSDIREILVKARRELLVLAAQVQAVTEQAVPKELGAGAEAPTDRERLAAGAPSGARQEVRHVLNEARPDLDALSIEATVLRANLLALRAPDAPAARAIGTPPPPDIDMPLAPAAAPQATIPAPPAGDPQPQASTHADIDDFVPGMPAGTFGADPDAPRVADEGPGPEEARPTRTTSPVIRSFDSAPSPGMSTGRAFVAAFAILAAVVVTGTGWWIYSQRSPGAETATNSPADPPPAAAPGLSDAASTNAASVSTAEEPAPALPSLVLEARSDSWIRAQIDGRPDAGRVYAAGETRTITGASRVSIRAGDAGAVYVSLNGGDLVPLGPAGRPLTRDFVLAEPTEPAPQPEAAPPPQDEADSPSSFEAAPATMPAPRAANPPVVAPAPASPPTPAAQPDTVTAGTPPLPDDELVGLSRRWLDAYLSGNSSTMLAVSGGTPDIRDQRPASERTSAAAAGARRIFEAPRLQRGADIGVFSVRMTERPTGAPTAPERVALVSQVWMRRAGKWQLIDVRIVSESEAKPAP